MLFLVFFVFGILVSTQFSGVAKNNSHNGISFKQLTLELEAERKENSRLLEQLAHIEAEHEQLLQNIGIRSNNEEINNLLKKRDYEYIRAGLVPVKGRGIVITMEDAAAVGELNMEDYIIHDGNINAILDELKANGAEAISVNGERVIFNTKPVCAGPTIIINENRYPPPYVIKAIGDPDVLYEAVETMADVAFMRLAEIRINVVKQDEVIVVRYRPYISLIKMFKDLEVVQK